VAWCDPLADLRAAWAAGMSTRAWLRFCLRAAARSGFARDDPAPFVRGVAWPVVRGRAGRLTARMRGRS